jgi:CcmD family protein
MLIALIQQAPAETTNYMVAGYTVIFSVIFAYIVSLIIRSRSLKREVQTLNDLDAEEK